jgi:hypothetical protein
MDLMTMVVDSLEGEGLPREEVYLQQDLGWDLHGTHGIQYLLLLPQKPLLPKRSLPYPIYTFRMDLRAHVKVFRKAI